MQVDIHDIKAPVALPSNGAFFLIFLIIILCVAGFFMFRFLKNRYKVHRTVEIEPDPPWIVAYKRLDELRKENFPASGQVEIYYVSLSDIIRRYIEDRFNIRAPDMTTEEFLYSLRTSQDLRSEHQQLLKNFLMACDMVKFAKYGPEVKEMEESFISAKRLIDETVDSG